MVENPGLSEREAAKLAPEKWRDLERDGGNGFRRWLREDTGVICFSTQKDDILMWSHYAGGHNGICIELQLTRKSHVDFFGNVHEVAYEDQPAIVHFYAPTDIEKVKAFVLTKARHWSYEQEWRLVIADKKKVPRYVNLPYGIISAIYLGCQISQEDRKEILDCLASKPAFKDTDIYQAQCDLKAFSLTFDPIRISKARRHIQVCRGERIDMDRLIEGTTDKWFVETVSRMNNGVKPDTPEDNLLFSAVPVAHNYCNAVFILADANHKLPAMAVLRVLAELTLRIMWCLYASNPQKEASCTRIMRWWKTTCEEEVKHLRKMVLSAGSKEAVRMKHAITYLQGEIAKNPHPSVGPFYNSLDELLPQIKEELYPLLYSPFNQAIHPNLKLFADLVREEGNQRVFLRDPEEPGTGTLKVAAMTDALYLLSIVYFNYRWDCEQMKNEYHAIKKEYEDQVRE
jgi:hypothetical protein